MHETAGGFACPLLMDLCPLLLCITSSKINVSLFSVPYGNRLFAPQEFAFAAQPPFASISGVLLISSSPQLMSATGRT